MIRGTTARWRSQSILYIYSPHARTLFFYYSSRLSLYRRHKLGWSYNRSEIGLGCCFWLLRCRCHCCCCCCCCCRRRSSGSPSCNFGSLLLQAASPSTVCCCSAAQTCWTLRRPSPGRPAECVVFARRTCCHVLGLRVCVCACVCL